MAAQDINAFVHIKDENGNVNNIYPATKIENVEGLQTALNAKANSSDVTSGLAGKVDKETGKGLSTNDYTTEEKNKLAGIEAQANKTVVDDALSDSSTNPVQNAVVTAALDEQNSSLVEGLATKADASTVSSLSDQVSTNTTNIAAQTARIDNIVALPSGSTQGDAELMDIRVKEDGTTASSAGDAVREQIAELKDDLSGNLYNITWTDGYYINSSNTLVENSSYAASNEIELYGAAKIHVKLYFESQARFLFLDKNKSVVQVIGNSGTEYDNVLDVPSKAKYMRCCTLKNRKLESRIFVDCLSILKNAVQSFTSVINSSATLDDCNNALPNKIYTITANVVNNTPSDNPQGTLITLAYSDTNVGQVQLFISPNNIMFFRLYWQNWSGWRELIDSRNYESTLSSMVNSKGNFNGSDLNAVGINTVYNIASNKSSSDLANAPFYPFQGTIFTVGGASNGNIAMQFVLTPMDNKLYFRKYWGNWSGWITLEEQVLPYLENQNGYEAFLAVGCIGDSLASGECYSNETGEAVGHDIYKYSWGQFMARASGNTYYNFSHGGLSTRTWLTSQYRQQIVDGSHDCMAYIIGLGANDALTDYRHVDVGSINDIDFNDYNNNADTYYGNYGKIIQILHEYNPKTKIFLLTMPNSNSIYQPYNEAVRELASTFDNCYCIDLYNNAFNLFNGSNSIIANGLRNGHYNAYAYGMMAKVIANEINSYMFSHKSEFAQIEFIDTENSWT